MCEDFLNSQKITDNVIDTNGIIYYVKIKYTE